MGSVDVNMSDSLESVQASHHPSTSKDNEENNNNSQDTTKNDVTLPTPTTAKNIPSTATTEKRSTRFEEQGLPIEVSVFLEKTKRTDETDILLVADYKKVPTHKALLSGYSNYFKRRFSTEKSKTSKGLQRIDVEIPPNLLPVLVDSLYNKGTTLNFDQAKELIAYTTKYEIEYISDKCIELLRDNLVSENCLDMIVLATESNNKKFIEMTQDSVKKYLKTILKSKNFQNLSFETICQLVGRKSGKMTGEIINKLVDGWLSYGNRREDVKIYTQIKLIETFGNEDVRKTSILDEKPDDFKLETSESYMPGWVWLSSLITPKAAAEATKAITADIVKLVAHNKAKRNHLGEDIKVQYLDEAITPTTSNKNLKRRRSSAMSDEEGNGSKNVFIGKIPKLEKKPRKGSGITIETQTEFNNSSDGNDTFGNNASCNNKNSNSNNGGRNNPFNNKSNNSSFNDDWSSNNNNNSNKSNNRNDEWSTPSSQNNNNNSQNDWDTPSNNNNSWGNNNNNNSNRGGSRGRGGGGRGFGNNNSSQGSSFGGFNNDEWSNNSNNNNNNNSSKDDDWGDTGGGNQSSRGGFNNSSNRGGNNNSNNDSWNSNSSTKNNDSWGDNGNNNSSWGSSNDSNNRGGRGRGRGGNRGDGRGGRGRGGPRERRPGDWDCSACGATGIFASKSECFKCREPKPEGVGNSSGGRGGRGGGRGGHNNNSWGSNDWGSTSTSNNDWGSTGTVKTTTATEDEDDWDTPATPTATTTTTTSNIPSQNNSTVTDNWSSSPLQILKTKTVNDDDGWENGSVSKPVPPKEQEAPVKIVEQPATTTTTNNNNEWDAQQTDKTSVESNTTTSKLTNDFSSSESSSIDKTSTSESSKPTENISTPEISKVQNTTSPSVDAVDDDEWE